MQLTVLYFAAARERARTSSETIDVRDGATAREVMDAIVARHPAVGDLRRHLRMAVNQEFVDLDEVVPAGAEIALIPPVSGGSGAFRVVDRPISLSDVVPVVEGEAMGGVVTFTGAVRNQTRGREVVRLEYEAYPPMAEQKMAEIAQEAAEKWPGSRLAIFHRVGVLLPGDAAVVIAASAPHRDEAFGACRHAIERLKQDVPIWKKEFFRDGEVWVGLGP